MSDDEITYYKALLAVLAFVAFVCMFVLMVGGTWALMRWWL